MVRPKTTLVDPRQGRELNQRAVAYRQIAVLGKHWHNLASQLVQLLHSRAHGVHLF